MTPGSETERAGDADHGTSPRGTPPAAEGGGGGLGTWTLGPGEVGAGRLNF